MGSMFSLCCQTESEDPLTKEDEKYIVRSYEGLSYTRQISLTPSIQINIDDIKTNKSIKSSSILHRVSNISITQSIVVRQNTNNPLDDYTLLKVLGQGSFGKVYKAQHKITKQIRALKKIKRSYIRKTISDFDICNEIEILRNLDHPKIIKIYEFYNNKDSIYIVNELCNEGDLCDKLAIMGFIPECIVKVLMLQIFSAISYLHHKHIIHGDLKLENILIDSVAMDEGTTKNDDSENRNNNDNFIGSILQDSEYINRNINQNGKFNFLKRNRNLKDENDIVTLKNKKNLKEGKLSSQNAISNIPNEKLKYKKLKNFDLKLSDFGCSKIFANENFKDVIGTSIYCAPEVLKNNYNEKCDIWSCGVMMYVLLCGKFPFYNEDNKKLEKLILNGIYSIKPLVKQNVSEECINLIKSCLTYDPIKRISIDQILVHPFFNDVDKKNIFSEKLDFVPEILNNIKKNVKKISKFHQAVLIFLSHNYMDKKHIDNVKKLFLLMDIEYDGKISRQELATVYKDFNVPLSEEELNNIFKFSDFDKTGYIEYEELIMASIPKDELFNDVNLKCAFEVFDIDKSGTISFNDVKKMLITEDVDENVLNELEKTVLGEKGKDMGFEEFKAFMKLIENDKDKEKDVENKEVNMNIIDQFGNFNCFSDIQKEDDINQDKVENQDENKNLEGSSGGPEVKAINN